MLIPQFKDLYLVGWKSIADYLGFHPRTIKRWHYERARLPFWKSHTSRQGRIIIAKYMVDIWVRYLGRRI